MHATLCDRCNGHIGDCARYNYTVYLPYEHDTKKIEVNKYDRYVGNYTIKQEKPMKLTTMQLCFACYVEVFDSVMEILDGGIK